jgi:O-antigen/teichoic acid export membrane protein
LSSEAVPYKSHASRKRAFIEHYGSTVLGQGLTLGLGVLTGIMSARMLGPAGRGEFAAINVWPLGIVLLLSVGINQGIAFHLGRRNFSLSEVATTTTAIGFIQSVLAIIIGLLVVPVVLAKYSPEVRLLGITFVLLTPALILSGYPANFFQGLQDMHRFNLIRVVAPSVYCLGLAVLYLARRGTLQGVIYWQLFGYVAALSFGLVMAWHFLRPRFQWNRAALPAIIHYGLRVQATNLTNYFNQRIDQMMLSLFVSPNQLGLYAVAVTLSTAVTVFPQAAGIVTFSRGSGQDQDHARKTIGHSFRASLVWLLAVCVILFAFAPSLIRLVFGPAFEGSILACRILLPGALVTGLNQVLYNGASALGRPGLPSIAEGISMALTAIGLYLLIPRYGYLGAAMVSTVAYTVSFLLMLGMAHRLLGLNLKVLLFG